MSDQNEFLRLLLAAETDLRAFVRSVLRDSAAVDDVFQETALVLWERFAEYDPARPFGAWGARDRAQCGRHTPCTVGR